MRILQAMAGGEQGGAEEFFLRLCQSFADRGVQQRALVRPHAGREAALRDTGVESATTAFGGLLDLISARRFQREIDCFMPDVVLTWMSRASRFCPARRRARTPFVQIGRLGGYYDLKYYRNCDHLIGNTADIVRYVTEQGWPAERVHYLPNFVSEGTAPPAERGKLGLPDAGPLLLALGRLHANKAFDVLIRALTQLPDAVLCIAGSGPLEHDLRRQAAALGIADRIAFPGWQADVAPLFAAADIYVCPSRIEPLGNVVIEAWAHRVPVVAAAATGPEALIEDGESGLLAPVDDADALAGAVQRFFDDRDLADRCVTAGLAVYETRFTETVVTDQYLDLFQRLVARKDAA